MKAPPSRVKQRVTDNGAWQRKPAAGRVSEPSDAAELEADAVAESVMSGRSGATGFAFSSVPVTAVQRQGDDEPKVEQLETDDPAGKAGEAFMATEYGQRLKGAVLGDPLVKEVIGAGEDFISTLGGKVVTGGVAVGVIASLAATHSELPLQVPEIPLGKWVPGLSVKLTYEGPVDAPTKGMLSFTYKSGGEKKKGAKSKTELQREENARLAADAARFRASMRVTPGSTEDRRQKQDDDALSRAAFSRVGQLPGMPTPASPLGGTTPLQTTPGLGPIGFQRPPFRLMDEKLKLAPVEQVPEAKAQEKKEDEKAAPPVQRKAAGTAAVSGAPPIVNDVLQGTGQPLDRSTRAFMESRFGYDFANVRVHSDERANRSARAIDATAYAVGDHVVFGAGKYTPGTSGGRRLLAHELTHVVQQTAPGASSVAIQRDTRETATPAAPKKFYQAIEDEIAGADADMARQLKEKKYQFMVHKPMNYDALKLLLPLAKAIDEGKTADIPALVDTFIAGDSQAPFRALQEDMLVEMSARLVTIGLETQAKKLRDNFSAGEKAWNTPYREDPGRARRDIAVYKASVDRAIAIADASTVEKSKVSLEVMIRVLDMLRVAVRAVDQKAPAEESPDSWRYSLHMTRKGYWKELIEVLATLVGGIETQLQAFMERAATDLGEGRGSATLLVLRDVVEKKLEPAISTADEEKGIGGITIPITKTEIRGGKGTITDSLSTDPKPRSVKVNTYTPDQDYARELQSTLIALVKVRKQQIARIAQIYGATDVLREDKKDEKELKADAAKNAETMKKVTAAGGKLRLDSDDDWRDFLLQKYKDETGQSAKDKGAALSSVIKLLFSYLKAFTVHARFTNIYDQGDFKDAYFNKPFPRTLAGQLVQDCGVYAMRVAYILSLVRKELGLRFQFVHMPAHLALVITGDGLPMFIAQNDHFKEYSPEKIKEFKDAWTERNKEDAAAASAAAPGKKQPPLPGEDQFVAELTALHYIDGQVDMPAAVTDVPATANTGAATQRALWAEYQRVSGKDVFGPATNDPKSDNYLFHNRYLALTELHREWFNNSLRPFWNEKAPAAWKTLEVALKAGGRTQITGSELAPLLEAHYTQITNDLKPANAALSGVEDKERRVGEQLRADPKLKAPGTVITRGGRFVLTHEWDTYRSRVADAIADAVGKPDAKFGIASLIDVALKPPFVPVPEKSYARAD